jgi:hypothetical protein
VGEQLCFFFTESNLGLTEVGRSGRLGTDRLRALALASRSGASLHPRPSPRWGAGIGRSGGAGERPSDRAQARRASHALQARRSPPWGDRRLGFVCFFLTFADRSDLFLTRTSLRTRKEDDAQRYRKRDPNSKRRYRKEQGS